MTTKKKNTKKGKFQKVEGIYQNHIFSIQKLNSAANVTVSCLHTFAHILMEQN